MTNKEILSIALTQSAYDSNCNAEDFLQNRNKVVISEKNPKARKYLELPFVCDLTTYGNNIVASVSKELEAVVSEYIEKLESYKCFDMPDMHILMNELEKFGFNICFMAEYFLPDADIMKPLDCGYNVMLLEQNDLEKYYLPEWSNALCKSRKELDVLGAGAFDGDKLVGLAGCSADCDTMRQIGIDVLPEYRRQGIAASLTSTLACEILKMGKVPFYCCAWSNIKSARTAVKSGFRPSWVQITAKTNEFISNMLSEK